jgi:hypothetical protein
MFEQIVRPFQTQRVLSTQRIVKSLSVATGQRAFLSWGAAGAIPAGVLQKKPTPLQQPGFSIVNAMDTWTQTETPVTEDVQVGGATVKRVREITFDSIVASRAATFSLVAAGVSDVIAGLLADMPGNRTKSSKYNTTWD